MKLKGEIEFENFVKAVKLGIDQNTENVIVFFTALNEDLYSLFFQNKQTKETKEYLVMKRKIINLIEDKEIEDEEFTYNIYKSAVVE